MKASNHSLAKSNCCKLLRGPEALVKIIDSFNLRDGERQRAFVCSRSRHRDSNRLYFLYRAAISHSIQAEGKCGNRWLAGSPSFGESTPDLKLFRLWLKQIWQSLESKNLADIHLCAIVSSCQLQYLLDHRWIWSLNHGYPMTHVGIRRCSPCNGISYASAWWPKPAENFQ